MLQIWLLLALFPLNVAAFASWMTEDFCDRPLVIGQVIMNNKVSLSSDRTISVFRGDEELISGSSYHPSESLTVSISDAKKQYVYEVTGGANFEKGGCGGKRISNLPKVVLKMPVAGDENDEISIVAAWAPGHEGVKLSSPFLLHPEASTSHHAIRRKRGLKSNIMEGKHFMEKEKGEDASLKGDKLDRRHPHPLERQNGETDLMRNAKEKKEKEDLVKELELKKGGERVVDEEAERRENDRRRDPLRLIVEEDKGDEQEDLPDDFPGYKEVQQKHQDFHNEKGNKVKVPPHPPVVKEAIEKSHVHKPLEELKKDYLNEDHHRDPLDEHASITKPHLPHELRMHDVHEPRMHDVHDRSLHVDSESKHASDESLSQRHAKHKEFETINSADMKEPKAQRIEVHKGIRHSKVHEGDLKLMHKDEMEGEEPSVESPHPHSHNIHDHDVYDISRKEEMDKIRDKNKRLFSGDEGEGDDVKITEESAEVESKGKEREKKRGRVGGRMVGGRREKVALRGAMTTYIKSHVVWIGELFVGLLVVLFMMYRFIFVKRHKIIKNLMRMTGAEEN